MIAHPVDDIWCSDLVEMQKLSKWNKGYKYLLMVLERKCDDDRYASARP